MPTVPVHLATIAKWEAGAPSETARGPVVEELLAAYAHPGRSYALTTSYVAHTGCAPQ